MYQALYRKYRPDNFDDVVGQDFIIKTLKNSIVNNKVSHAYMFFGPRGVGKTTVAKILSRAVNCLEPIDGNPCGHCKNCLNSIEKQCVDIIEIDAASNNGVDEIREIRSKVNLVPTALKYKVYIIDEVHMLTQGAFNALLKTLEEPPKHIIFILATTDPQKVSDTIISRCQCFSFKRIPISDNTERLKTICNKEKIIVDDDVLNNISLFSDGGLRDSLGLLDKLTSYKNTNISMNDFYEINDMVSIKEIEELLNDTINSNQKGIIEKIEKFNDSGKNIIEIINQLIFLLKDKIIDYYINDCNQYDIDKLEYISKTLNENLFDIKQTTKPYIYIEIILLQISKANEIISREIINNKSVKICKEELPLNNNQNGENLTEKKENGNNNLIQKEEQEVCDTFSNIGSKKEIDIGILKKIMKIRVNNTLALANKNEKSIDTEKIKKLNDYVFDVNYGYLVSELLNGKLCASCKESLILSYEYDSIVEQNLKNIEQLTSVFNKFTNSNKKIAIITDIDWENEKKIYIEFTKQGNKYTIKEEPSIEVDKEAKIDDSNSESVLEMFGDIVEIN